VPIEEVVGAVKVTDSGRQGSRIKNLLVVWRGVNYASGLSAVNRWAAKIAVVIALLDKPAVAPSQVKTDRPLAEFASTAKMVRTANRPDDNWTRPSLLDSRDGRVFLLAGQETTCCWLRDPHHEK
jgi:hypothetical protein